MSIVWWALFTWSLLQITTVTTKLSFCIIRLFLEAGGLASVINGDELKNCSAVLYMVS